MGCLISKCNKVYTTNSKINSQGTMTNNDDISNKIIDMQKTIDTIIDDIYENNTDLVSDII